MPVWSDTYRFDAWLEVNPMVAVAMLLRVLKVVLEIDNHSSNEIWYVL
jgi:hypothetical protein